MDWMNNMVYLAGPIDDIDPGRANGWRKHAAAELMKFGLTCYNPASAFIVPETISTNHELVVARNASRALLSINRAAVGVCQYMLANLGGPGKGVGTSQEIMWAIERDRTDVFVVQGDSSWRYALCHPRIWVFETLDIALVKLGQIHAENFKRYPMRFT